MQRHRYVIRGNRPRSPPTPAALPASHESPLPPSSAALQAPARSSSPLQPLRIALWVGMGIAALAVGALSIFYAQSPRISLMDVEVPQTLADRGLTPGRVEIVIQQALQRIADNATGAMDLNPVLRADGSVGTAVTVRSANAHSYAAAFADVESRSLALTIPGQAVSIGKAARLIAFHVPGAARQTFVTVRLALRGQDEVDAQVTVEGSDTGTSVLRFTGKSDDLTNPASAFVEEVGLGIISRAMPSLGFSTRISNELKACRCIRPETLASVEARIAEVGPSDLGYILNQMGDIYADTDTDAESIEAIDRLRLRARLEFKNDDWRAYDRAIFESRKASCEISRGRLRVADHWRWLISQRYGSPSWQANELLPLICLTNLPVDTLLSRVPEIEGLIDTHSSEMMIDSLTGMLVSLRMLGTTDTEMASRERLLERVAARWGDSLVADGARLVRAGMADNMAEVEAQSRILIGRSAEEPCTNRSTRTYCVEFFRSFQSVFAELGAGWLRRGKSGADVRTDLCQNAVVLQPDDGDAHECLAQAHADAGRPSKAAAWYASLYRLKAGRAIKEYEAENVTSEMIAIRRDAARMLLRQGLAADAKLMLGYSHNPGQYDPELLWIAALQCDTPAYARLQPSVDAKSEFALAALAHPTAYKSDFLAGELHLSALAKAFPDSAAHAHALALFHLARQSAADAKAALERALKLSPGDTELIRLQGLASRLETSPGKPVADQLCFGGRQPIGAPQWK